MIVLDHAVDTSAAGSALWASRAGVEIPETAQTVIKSIAYVLPAAVVFPVDYADFHDNRKTLGR